MTEPMRLKDLMARLDRSLADVYDTPEGLGFTLPYLPVDHLMAFPGCAARGRDGPYQVLDIPTDKGVVRIRGTVRPEPDGSQTLMNGDVTVLGLHPVNNYWHI